MKNSNVNYDNLWKESWSLVQDYGPLTRSRYRIILKKLQAIDLSNAKILDVGCGSGRLLSLIKARWPNCSIAGHELSTEAISQAPEPLQQCITQGSIDKLAVQHKNTRYDVILCSEVLEHVPDYASAISDMTSLLASNGTLVITVPAYMKYWSSQDEFAGHLRRFEPEELRNCILQHELYEQQIYTWGSCFAGLYNYLLMHIDAKAILNSKDTLFKRALASLLYHSFRIDDLIKTNNGFQLICVARKQHV